MSTAPTADELVAAYLKIRSAIQFKEEAHKAEIEDLKAQQDVISEALLGLCNEQNVEGLRTKAGTVSRRIQTRYWTNDWSSMYDFIKEHDALYLMEQRIHNGNMKQFLEENPDVLPIGLQADRKYVITVRKPTAK
jgi:predicted secreted Zn-dependent protease